MHSLHMIAIKVAFVVVQPLHCCFYKL
jgi:hypothetical protein